MNDDWLVDYILFSN